MLDGKRYYTAFPDEDPELRPRLTAVLDALANVNKAFRQHFEALRPRGPDLAALAGCRAASRLDRSVCTNSAFEYRQIDIIGEHPPSSAYPGWDRRSC
jgi:hypothetical protein